MSRPCIYIYIYIVDTVSYSFVRGKEIDGRGLSRRLISLPVVSTVIIPPRIRGVAPSFVDVHRFYLRYKGDQ